MINEREIQNSLEVITVTNPGFVGVGAEIIVVTSTHLKGVGWRKFVMRARTGQVTCESFDKMTLPLQPHLLQIDSLIIQTSV